MPTEAECNAAENPKHTSFVDSQGSTFTFNNITYGATSVNLQVDGYDAGDQTVDLSDNTITTVGNQAVPNKGPRRGLNSK